MSAAVDSRELYNPDSDQRIILLQTGRETGGELLEVELEAGPESRPPVEHIHRFQEETFEILEGTVQLRVAGQDRTMGPRERTTLPPGTPHVWWNSGRENVKMRCEFRPAGEMEEFWRVVFRLAQEGKTRNSVPRPVPRMAVVLNRYGDSTWPARQKEVPLTRLPFPLQRAVIFVLAGIGHLLGYRAEVPAD